MKYSLAAALPTMAALAAAQGIPTNIPSCGLACIATVARDAGCAQPDDVNCLCEAYDRIAPNSQPCLEAECSDSEVDGTSLFCARGPWLARFLLASSASPQKRLHKNESK